MQDQQQEKLHEPFVLHHVWAALPVRGQQSPCLGVLCPQSTGFLLGGEHRSKPNQLRWGKC